MRVALYCRVSTEEQNVALQLNDLRPYAALRKFTIVEEYVDLGFTGSKTSRPALDRLMKDAHKRKFDVVLVWRFDRFGRSTKHLAMALDEFRALNIQFISFGENIDTTTPMGAAMFTIISAMAQFERELLIERVKAGIKTAKAAGKHCGRSRASIPKVVRDLYDEGLSIRAIAAKLGVGRGSVERALKLTKPVVQTKEVTA
jgi:DNA invertase Pin-like site-specific DNA recombinase